MVAITVSIKILEGAAGAACVAGVNRLVVWAAEGAPKLCSR